MEKKTTRKQIAEDTLKTLEQGTYTNPLGEVIDLSQQQQSAVEQTKLYTPEALDALINQPISSTPDFTTTFEVNRLTTLDAVRQEAAHDEHVLCLNFASARNPGGGFLKGSQAQEESIARASGLYPCQLKAEAYYQTNRAVRSCFYTDHMIYSPAVPIFKLEDGTLMEQPVYAGIITAPAVNTGVVKHREPERMDQIIPAMHRRIDMVLAIALSTWPF
jgi:uncharacterized protein (TIGR02452 family)